MLVIDHNQSKTQRMIRLKNSGVFISFLQYVETRFRKLSLPPVFALTAEYYSYFSLTDTYFADTVHLIRLHFESSHRLRSMPPEFCLPADGMGKLLKK